MKPLPLLTLLALFLTCPARAQESDPFAGDARLLKKHTIKAAGIPLKELLEQLTKETGIRLTASPRVAEDKVVLFVNNRPIADSLRVIAAFFKFEWGKIGESDAPIYSLTQSLKQQRLEDEEIEAEYFRAADQIIREISIIRKHAAKSKQELTTLAESLRQEDAQAGTTPSEQRLVETRILHALIRSDNPILAARFLHSADRNELVRLLKTPRLVYQWPPTAGKGSLNAEIRDEIIKLVLAQVAKYRSDTDQFNFASIVINGSPGVEPKLRGMFNAGVVSASSSNMSGTGFYFPMFDLFRLAVGREPLEPAGWKEDQRLNTIANLVVRQQRQDSDENRIPLPPPAMVSMLAKIAESAPIDFIADAFYGTQPIDLSVGNKPIGEILTAVCLATGHRWTSTDGLVSIRDAKYAATRRAEPSIYLLRKLAALPQERLYTLDSLAEMADQSLPQYETTLRVLDEAGILARSNPLGSTRGHLMFWNRLNPAQRQAALSENGLPYRTLSRELRELFELASLDLLAGWQIQSSNQDKVWPLEALTSASYSVFKTTQDMWGFRTSTGHSTLGGTREQVFEKLKREHPTLTIDQLQAARSINYRFSYSGRGFATTGVLSTPITWTKAN